MIMLDLVCILPAERTGASRVVIRRGYIRPDSPSRNDVCTEVRRGRVDPKADNLTKLLE